MVTTTNLGEAVGVQHAGLHDRTTANTVQGITHGLIIGKFKRGRTDQPMRINKDNIRARLGYEPVNPFYQVVQDCLDKFPSVWVLRVANIENIEPDEFSFLRAEQSDDLILFDGDLSPILIENGVN